MTNDDLVRELRERHSETLVEETADGRLERCKLCSEWWPCDAIRAADEIERLREEEIGMQDLIESQGKLLTGVVNAIRGEPEPLHLHSHHDAVELVRAAISRANESMERAWKAGLAAHNTYVRDWTSKSVSDAYFDKCMQRDLAALREGK